MKVKKSTCFFVISLLLVIGSILLFVKYFSSYKNTDKTEARIVTVTVERDEKGNTSHTLFLSYKVANIPYTTKTNKYRGKVVAGDEIVVSYKKNNPQELIFDFSHIGGSILIGVSLVSALIGFIYKKKSD